MSHPQQILHVIGDLDGYGLTRQLELLVAQQLDSGDDVRIVALRADPQVAALFHQHGVRCRTLDRRWRRDPFAAMRLAGELRQSSCDVLHLWGQTAVDYTRAVRRCYSTRPTLASLQNRTVLESRSVGQITPGIATMDAASLSRAEFLAEQKLPDNSLLIAVAGPLIRQQQIDEAIWYFELVRALDERLRLLVFGDGPDRHRLERFSRLASKPSAIRFLGYRTDYRELLPYVDLFWQTALTSDALPQTVLEAMGARVPVVANDGAGSRAVIRDGENGCLVPDKDRAGYARQSRKLLYDDEHAEKIRTDAAATIAEQYTVAAMTQVYGDLYGELLNR